MFVQVVRSTRLNGADLNPGDTADIPEALAADWFNLGFAVPYAPPAAPEPDAAAITPEARTAARSRPRTRRKP